MQAAKCASFRSRNRLESPHSPRSARTQLRNVRESRSRDFFCHSPTIVKISTPKIIIHPRLRFSRHVSARRPIDLVSIVRENFGPRDYIRPVSIPTWSTLIFQVERFGHSNRAHDANYLGWLIESCSAMSVLCEIAAGAYFL